MRHMTFHRAIALTLLGCGVAAAQTAPAPPPQKTEIEERVGVFLVQLPLIATDKKGRPITDLSVDELVVKDRGKGREIAYLEWLGKVEMPVDLAPARLFVEAPGGVQAVARTPGREYVAFFVDMENTDRLGRDAALEDLLEFVGKLERGTFVSVISYDGELHLDLPFTAESELWVGALREAFNRHGRGEMDLQSRMNQLLDKFSDCVVSGGGGEASAVVGDPDCLQSVITVYQEERRPRGENYITALHDMIKIVGGLPGRKTVLTLSHGVAINTTPEILEAMRAVFGITDQLSQMQLYSGGGDHRQVLMDRMIRFARDQRVVLHFIDWSRAPGGDVGARRGHALQPGTQPIQVAFNAAQYDAEEIGVATGGVFVSGPDMEYALGKVADARLGTYELGYYVRDRGDFSNKSKVVVDCKRKGVQISHRRVYMPSPPSSTIPGRIVLGAARPPVEPAMFAAHYPFLLQFDPRSIGYGVKGDEASATFTLHVAVADVAGRRLAETYNYIQHSYPRANWESDEIEWVTIRGWVELPPGGFHLTAHVNNPDRAAGGKLVTAIEVEPAPAEPAGP